MPLTGQAKTDYQREYMRRRAAEKRAASAAEKHTPSAPRVMPPSAPVIEGRFRDVTPPRSRGGAVVPYRPPSRSLTAIASGTAQFMPGDPRGRQLGQPQPIMPANGFAVFADDPAEYGEAFQALQWEATRQGVARLAAENRRLREALEAEREPSWLVRWLAKF